jgi:hypothetical protein
MTKIVEKEVGSSNPTARKGEHWLVLSKSAEHTNEFGRRVAPASLNIIFNATSFHSPVGLGNTRLKLARVPVKDDGDALAATLSTCTSIEGARYLDKEFVEQLVAEASDASDVADHYEIVQTIHSLNSLESISRRRLATYDHVHGYEHCIIAAGKYGHALVPKSQAAPLLEAEGEPPDALRFTHVLCDVLGTKHALMQSLGLAAAIETDNHLIGNSLKMLEASR